MEVKRQVDHVDIIAEIGAGHLLVIEDKVHASEHSNQLKLFAQAVKKRYPDRAPALIFLKTGDQASYSGVTADGWTTFLRHELLMVLRRGGECSNAIFRDFLAILSTREAAVHRVTTAPVAEWEARDPAYIGLYLELQTRLKDGKWAYVPNEAGGFFAFWWSVETLQGGTLYLQIEEKSLVAKVAVKKDSRRREMRDRWSRRIVGGVPGFARPGRFGHGQCMTVATRGDYRVTGADGRIDLPATVQLLREAAAALSRLVAEATAS